MGKKRILVMADRLAVYAIERQNGFERHQPPDGPPWQERRRFWTDAILQGMARLEGLTPDPGWMKQFDRRLEAARGCPAVETLPTREQAVLIRGLSRFVSALETAGGDRRRQIAVVRDLLEDMSTHLPWASADNSLNLARDEAERALRRMTAQMPIRFTRVLLGGDAGPHWASGFVSGAVTDSESVRQTPVYQNAVRVYPDITDWPALCTVYVGHGLSSALGTMDASGFDLEIMNGAGDSFLKEQGVRCVGGPFQMSVQTAAQAGMQYPFLQGKRPLTAGDLEVLERTGAENGWITFCLDVLAGEEAVFGRQLSSEEEDSYIQVYTSYSEHTGRVDDTLDIVIRSPGGDEWFSCSLTDETREFLKQKMDAFCVESCGEHLPEPVVQAPSQMGLVM